MTWFDLMAPEFLALGERLAQKALSLRSQGRVIYPPQEQIFRALELTPPEHTKIVLVGQDPYINPGQAEGLCFSVKPGMPNPPSLENIFKEMCDDLGCPKPACGSLLPWAQHGVLLLNTALTVEAGCSNSHADWGWDRFAHHVFDIASKLPQPIVFIAWGANAQRAIADLNVPYLWPKKALISSSHPSPFSANRGFFGSKPFSSANRLLQVMGSDPVDWTLP